MITFATQAQNLTSGNAAIFTLPIEGFVHANDENDNLIDAEHPACGDRGPAGPGGCCSGPARAPPEGAPGGGV